MKQQLMVLLEPPPSLLSLAIFRPRGRRSGCLCARGHTERHTPIIHPCLLLSWSSSLSLWCNCFRCDAVVLAYLRWHTILFTLAYNSTHAYSQRSGERWSCVAGCDMCETEPISWSVCVCVCQCLFSAFHTVISLLRSLYQSQHGKMYHFSSCDRFN